ncbi:MAG: SUMF1/EgtB/PvdO family nonheme iron enzyme [Rectinemataceae bacterium]
MALTHSKLSLVGALCAAAALFVACPSPSGPPVSAAQKAIDSLSLSDFTGPDGSPINAKKLTTSFVVPLTKLGARLTWTCDSIYVSKVDPASGQVFLSIPDGLGSETTVAVRVEAEVASDSSSATESWSLTIPVVADAEAVTESLRGLAGSLLDFSGTDSLTHVTGDFALPTLGNFGTEVSWELSAAPARGSSLSGVTLVPGDPATGTPTTVQVTTPSTSAVSVALTPSVKKKGGSAAATPAAAPIVITVPVVTDQEKIDLDAAAIAELVTNALVAAGHGDSLSGISAGFALPQTGPRGTTLAWTVTAARAATDALVLGTAALGSVPVIVTPAASDTSLALTASVSMPASTTSPTAKPASVSVKVKGKSTGSGTISASLATLTVSAGTLTPTFSPTVKSYTVAVASTVASITFGATCGDSTATVTKPVGAQTLSPGANSYTITATASDGVTNTDYVVIVTKSRDLSSTNVGAMVWVPGGTFQRDATATHTSKVSGFWMGSTEITRAQFLSVMGSDPSDVTYSLTDNSPAQNFSFNAAITFCNKLSIKEGLKPVYSVTGVDFATVTMADLPTLLDGYNNSAKAITWNAVTANWDASGYRLPTEMENLWASMGADSAAAGVVNTTGYTKRYAGDDLVAGIGTYERIIGDYVLYNVRTLQPVGTKLPNELGIYDLSGNVAELLWDRLSDWPTSAVTDYRGASTTVNRRMLTGVACNGFYYNYTLAAYRLNSATEVHQYHYYNGIRVARGLPVASVNANLSALALSSGTLIPAFAAATTAYDVYLPSTATTITVTGTKADSYASLGSSSGTAQSLTSATTTVTIRVTAEDTAVTKDYVVTVHKTDDVVSATIGNLVKVPAGSFQRDATTGNISTITTAYYIGQYEVTREAFKAVMVTDPSNTSDVVSSGSLKEPVNTVSWYQAITFCNKLSTSEGLEPVYSASGITFATLAYADIPTSTNGLTAWTVTADYSKSGYRLPSAMEWMWAAMGADTGAAGTTNTTGFTKWVPGYSGGNVESEIAKYAVFNNRLASVGSKLPNELRLYDMGGNVYEWTGDWRVDPYLTPIPAGTLPDYRGADSGTLRRGFGGSTSTGANGVAVATTNSWSPSVTSTDLGFRVVRK